MEYYCQLISSFQNSSSSPSVELKNKETVTLGQEGAAGGAGQVSASVNHLPEAHCLFYMLSCYCLFYSRFRLQLI